MQVYERFRIHKNPHIPKLVNPIALPRLRVEANVVAQARAPAALHSQTQPALFRRDALLDDGRPNLRQRLLRDLHTLRRRGPRRLCLFDNRSHNG